MDDNSQAQIDNQESINDNQEEQPKKKKRPILLIIAGSILVLCCGLFGLGLILPDSDSNEAEPVAEQADVSEEAVVEADVESEAVEVVEEAVVEPTATPEPPTLTPEPTSTPAPTDTPEPTATPEPPTPTPGPVLELSEANDYVDSIDYLHIVGEVTNIGDVPLTFVQVVATLYDEGGGVVDTDFTYTELDVLMPGQTSPYNIAIEDGGKASSYAIQVEGREADELPYLDLEILSSNDFIDDIGYWHIVGEVRNNGSSPVEFVNIVASAYQGENIVDTSFTYTDLDVVQPGGTSPFEVVFSDDGGSGDAERYILQPQGRPVR